MNRRQFIKTVGMTAGGLSLARYADAFNLVPLIPQGKNSSGGSGVPKAYADWMMDSEASLANVDYVMLCENTTAGGNETGQSPAGTISGANLVGTQANNLGGAVGTPPYRPFTITGQSISFTSTCAETALTNSAWSVLMCIDNFTSNLANYPFRFISGGSAAIQVYVSGVAISFMAYLGSDWVLNASPGNISTVDKLVMGVWCDGTYTRGGWTALTGSGIAGQPTKWSDFAAGQRVSVTSGCNFTASSFAASKINYAGTGNMIADVYWIIMDSTCLIDNAA